MDMKDMVHMQMDKKQVEPKEGHSEDEQQYPYGLQLNLDKDSMEKLGMKEMPKMGQTMMMQGKAIVTNMHESEGHKSIGLQITHMGMMDEEKPKKSDAEVLYGKENE